MRKYESIINNISLEDKIHLLLTRNDDQSQKIMNYYFPELKVSSDLTTISRSNLDNLRNIAQTWNEQLIQEVGKVVGNNYSSGAIEVKISTDDNTIDYISSDDYLSGVVAGNFIKGLNESDSFSVLSQMKNETKGLGQYRNKDLLSFEIATQKGNPTMVKISNNNAYDILKEWQYQGYKYFYAGSSNETVKSLANGAVLTVTEFEEDVVKAVKLYQEKKIALLQEEITKEEFDRLLEDGVILEVSKIDDLLNDYFCMLEKLNNIYDKQVALEELPIDYYQESIILLENDYTLPINIDSSLDDICLLGGIIEEVDKDTSFLRYTESNGFKFGGYTRGYLKDLDTAETTRCALDVANNFNAIICFVPLEFGLVNENILQLLEQLKNKQKKIILVLFGNVSPRIDLAEYASVIMQVPAYQKQFFKPILDVLFGNVNPSGRVVTVGNKQNIFTREELNTTDAQFIYPLGYGLSYTEFKYSDLRFNNNKLQVTIENKGIHDGNEVIQVYVKAPYEDYKKLVAFKKVFLKVGQKRIFDIELDDKAFRYYFEDYKTFGIKEGNYELSLCLNANEVLISTDIYFNEFALKNDEENILINSGDNTLINEFVLTNAKKNYRKQQLGMSFGKKLAIAIVVDVYYSIICIGLGIIALQYGLLAGGISALVVALISNIIFIICLVKFIKRRKEQKELTRQFELEDNKEELINTLSDFEISKQIVYSIPKPIETKVEVEEVVEEEIIEEIEKTDEEQLQEQLELKASDDEDLEFTMPYIVPELKGLNKEKGKFVLLDNLCSQFNDILLKSGLVLELSQIRSLLAAVLSSKMIFAHSSNKEGLIQVFKIMDAFFGNTLNVISTSENWQNTIDLLWVPSSTEGVYTYSDFSMELLSAKANPDGLKVILLDNINIETFPKYFHKFIRSSQSPKIDYYIKLDEIIKIPTNVCYVLVPSSLDFIEHMNPKIIDSSLTLNLDIRNSNITEVEVEPYSYKELREQIKERTSEVFMEEEEWKKLDSLEDDVHNLDISYSHSNRSVLLMEKFLNVLLMIDPERYVLEDALLMYYIPLLKALPLYKKNNGDQEIKNIISKIFGSDNVPLALQMIMKPLEIEEENIQDEESNQKVEEEK